MDTPAAGHPQVEVICAEGTDGYPPGAPYDRSLVTAGAWDVASAWWQQLVVGGCIVVSLCLHSSGLTDDVVLHLDAADIEDEAALGQALSYPAHEHWTGVTIGDREPVEHLDLWLVTTSSRFARLSVGAAARESALVKPALRWAGAARYDGGTLAYLVLRPHSSESTELGVMAHGPDSNKLATQTANLLHRSVAPVEPCTAHPARHHRLPGGHAR
jgi:protein-L-isoaspartate(D-aspartate) O-methyltransferase